MTPWRRSFPFLLAAAALLATETPPGRIGFPLAVDDGVSSTFQEFRGNHFHAGIDLRTRRQTGFAVRAIADGTVVRLTVSRRGYGRALLLRHAGGATSLYAHLERFRPDLEAQAGRQRARRGEKYFGEYTMAEPLPVRRGETIAFSGESGAGFPHLHLEVRDGSGYALNPLANMDDAPPDAQPPQLQGLLLRSRRGALVNGAPGEFYFRLRREGGVYRTAAPLRLSGACDVVLHAADLSGAGHAVAPFRLQARLDGRPVFRETFDRLCRDDNNQLGMLYDMAYSTPADFFFNLCSQEGFLLEETGQRLADDLERLAPGRHELWLAVEDCQGNRAEARLAIEKEAGEFPAPAPRRCDRPEAGAGVMRDCEFSLQANRGEVLVKAEGFPAPAARLRLRLLQGQEQRVIAAREYDQGVFFSFPPLNHESPLRLLFELTDGAIAVESRQLVLEAVWLMNHLAQTARLGDFAADFGPTTVREPTVLLLEKRECRTELPLLGTPIRAFPDHFAFLDSVFFKFRAPPGVQRPGQLGIFRLKRDGSWKYLPTTHESGSGFFSCRVLNGGTYALLRDVFPPAIALDKPGDRHARGLRRLVARIHDRGKGIADESLAVFLNGARLDVEFDPDWGHVLIDDPAGLKRGENALRVRIADLAGNWGEKTFRFSLK